MPGMTCPTCGERFQVPANLPARSVECPECNEPVALPDDGIQAKPKRPAAAPVPPPAPPAPPEPVKVQPHRGGLILGMGILGVFFPLFAIAAVRMCADDEAMMEAGKMDKADGGLTSLGGTLGWLVVIAWGIALLVGALWLVSVIARA